MSDEDDTYESEENRCGHCGIPPLRVCSRTLRVTDGFHRKVAYERERATQVLCALEDVADDVDLFRRAAAANASHGRRYSVDDYATAVPSPSASA